MWKGKETKFVTLLETVGQMKIDQNYFGQITWPFSIHGPGIVSAYFMKSPS